VLLGAFVIRRPWQLKLNVVTKDKILFCCSIVNVELGQKLKSEPEDETRYSSATMAQSIYVKAVA